MRWQYWSVKGGRRLGRRKDFGLGFLSGSTQETWLWCQKCFPPGGSNLPTFSKWVSLPFHCFIVAISLPVQLPDFSEDRIRKGFATSLTWSSQTPSFADEGGIKRSSECSLGASRAEEGQSSMHGRAKEIWKTEGRRKHQRGGLESRYKTMF